MNLQTAQRLQQLRKQHGYSQEELAEKLNVSRQAVSKWERGEASPDTDNLIQLSAIYGITLDELLNGTQANDPTTQEQGSDNKDSIHIDKGGIHLTDDEGHTLHIGKAPRDKEPTRECTTEEVSEVYYHHGKTTAFDSEGKPVSVKKNHIKSVLDGITTLVILCVYLTLGCTLNLWHPAWLLFLLIPTVLSIGECIEKHDPQKFAYPILVVTIYLFVGLLWHIWHPTWILFITIPVYYTILGSFFGHDKDDDEDDD